MKVHVIHDSQGNIKSLVAPGPDFVTTVHAGAKENELVTVVEQPEIDEGNALYHLMRLSKLYYVDTATHKLVSKE